MTVFLFQSYIHAAILVENHRIFPYPVFLPPPPKKGFPLELGTGAAALEIKNAHDGAIGPKRSLTMTSTYVTDGWTDRRTSGHGTTAKTALTCSVSRLKP